MTRFQSRAYRASPVYVGADHITAQHPGCSVCGKPASRWQRCRCKAWFARCGDHKPAEIAKMRAEHRCEVKR